MNPTNKSASKPTNKPKAGGVKSASGNTGETPVPPAGVQTHTPSDPLNRLRGFRVYPPRARSLGDDMDRQMQAMKKISHAESAANDAWLTVVPDQIRDCTKVGGLRAGKMTIYVDSAAQRFQVDRWLGSGGMGAFQALARVPIRGVEIKIAPAQGQS